MLIHASSIESPSPVHPQNLFTLWAHTRSEDSPPPETLHPPFFTNCTASSVTIGCSARTYVEQVSKLLGNPPPFFFLFALFPDYPTIQNVLENSVDTRVKAVHLTLKRTLSLIPQPYAQRRKRNGVLRLPPGFAIFFSAFVSVPSHPRALSHFACPKDEYLHIFSDSTAISFRCPDCNKLMQ